MDNRMEHGNESDQLILGIYKHFGYYTIFLEHHGAFRKIIVDEAIHLIQSVSWSGFASSL